MGNNFGEKITYCGEPLLFDMKVITINVTVVDMARYGMVLRRATSFRGALEFGKGVP
jgi:hypothetical protein